ncbi:MAG: FtsX-like permease family protein, partial [Streptosporangiaceae bacterium]
MSRSQSVRAAFLLRRMRASRLVIGCVLLMTLVASTLLAALGDFSAVFLSQAATQQVASSGELAVQVNSTASAAQAGPASRFVASSLRSAFGPRGLALQSALWSDPLNLGSPAVAGSQPIAEVAALGGIGRHVRLLAGTWPRSSRPGQPYPVVVPAGDASELGLRPGQALTLTDGDTGGQVDVQISGVYQIEDPAARYWGLDLIPISGVSVQAGFRTYGPLLTAPASFAPGRLPVGQRSWLATPTVAAIPPGSMGALAGRIRQAVVRLGQSQGYGGIVASSSMPQLLTGTVASYEVARALLVIGGLELLLVASAALALTARLLASGRETESALLTARGLTRRQIGLLALTEATTAAIVAAAVGVVLGGVLARVLAAASGSLHGIRPAAAALSQAGLRAGWWPAIVVVLLATVVLGWPAASSATAAGHGARRGRPAALATVSRASFDVAIIVLAALTAWQLRQYSAVAHGASGVLGVDPVLAVAPALILAGVALIPLRLMPAAARLADRLAAHGTRLTTALAAWQLSRRPVRQAGPALLAILAVGTSTLALAEELSWRESVRA